MLCRTGRHDWLSPVSAQRCCDPHWRRELRMWRAEDGDDAAEASYVHGEPLLFVWRWCGPSDERAEAVSHHRGAAPATADNTG